MPDLHAQLEADPATIVLGRMRARLGPQLDRELDALGEDAEMIFAAFAPSKSGRLARGIVATRAGRMVVVRSTARDPSSGYEYTGVTRFGHRAAYIYPKARRSASVVATRGERARGRRAALRFTLGGRVVYASRVRGYRPASDWATDALPAVEQAADAAAGRLGRRVNASAA